MGAYDEVDAGEIECPDCCCGDDETPPVGQYAPHYSSLYYPGYDFIYFSPQIITIT